MSRDQFGRKLSNLDWEHRKASEERAKARKTMMENGSPEMQTAVKLAEAGYGFEDIAHMTNVSMATARLLVLGR